VGSGACIVASAAAFAPTACIVVNVARGHGGVCDVTQRRGGGGGVRAHHERVVGGCGARGSAGPGGVSSLAHHRGGVHCARPRAAAALAVVRRECLV
jgi:hypothetical protein